VGLDGRTYPVYQWHPASGYPNVTNTFLAFLNVGEAIPYITVFMSSGVHTLTIPSCVASDGGDYYLVSAFQYQSLQSVPSYPIRWCKF